MAIPIRPCEFICSFSYFGLLQSFRLHLTNKDSTETKVTRGLSGWPQPSGSTASSLPSTGPPHPGPADKARGPGHWAKQRYGIYQIHMRHGGRKRPVLKCATYGKPVHHGVNQLKFARSLQSVARSKLDATVGL